MWGCQKIRNRKPENGITFSVCESYQVADSIDYPRGDFWFSCNSFECDAKEHEDLVEKFHMLEC